MLRITYEVVTPESAEHGDAEERGFIEPQFNIRVPIDEALTDDWKGDALNWTLRDAEIFLGRNDMEDSGRWFSSINPEIDFQSGAETRYSLHPVGEISPASYARLARIFEWRRVDWAA